MMSLLLGLLLVLSPILAGAAENSVTLEKSLRPLMDKAGKVQVTLPEENPEARQAADALFRLYRSDAFQERILQERQRLAEEFFGAEPKCAPENPESSPDDGSLGSNDRFYLFVSSSMPLETLRNYAADLTILNDPRFTIVLRGFVGGAKRIGPTAAFISDVLKTNPDCELGSTKECAMREIPFIVDPQLFRKTGITQVPAMVFIPGNRNDLLGTGKGSSGARMTGESLIVYGDASLGHALELMARETGNPGLAHLAARLKPIP